MGKDKMSYTIYAPGFADGKEARQMEIVFTRALKDNAR